MRARAVTRTFFAVSLSIALCVTFYAGIVGVRGETRAQQLGAPFATAWRLAMPDGTERTLDLPTDAQMYSGDTFTLSNTLPDELPQDPVLHVKIYHNDITAAVGGQPRSIEGIYYNSTLRQELNEMWGTITLNPQDAGKVLTLTVVEKNKMAGINLSGLSIINRTALLQKLIQQKLPVVVVVCIMGCLSVLLLIAGMFYLRKNLSKEPLSFFYLAAFVLLSGLWLLMDSKLIGLLYGYTDVQYFLSFYSFMLMPMPFCFFLQDTFPQRGSAFGLFAFILSGVPLVGTVLLACGVIKSLTQVLFVTHIVIACAAVTYCGRLWEKIRVEGYAQMLKLSFATLALMALSVAGMWMFYRDDERYAFLFAVGLLGFTLYVSMNMMQSFQAMAKSAQESENNKSLAVQARNTLKVSQITTHFFYHILSSIRVLTKINPDVAYKMLGDMSKYLRYKTDGSDLAGSLVLLRDEMRAVTAYADLKLVLLEGRLQMEYDIDAQDFYIPMLSIQPLVENAIEHGIEPVRHGGTVRLTVREQMECYEIKIEDNGCGYNPTSPAAEGGVSAGQRNIAERLSHYQGCDMQVQSALGGGTCVTVTIGKGLSK